MESGELRVKSGKTCSHREEAFSFERLGVWQEAAEFAGELYTLTAGFPKAETFGLMMQLRRAGVLVAANIAEGASRSSGKDRARFYEIAYGSLNEIVTLLHIATRQDFVKRQALVSARSSIAEMCRMLSSLKRRALRAADESGLSTLNSPLST